MDSASTDTMTNPASTTIDFATNPATRHPAVVASAYDAGVPIYVGTDAGGGIGHGEAAAEMLLLRERAGLSTMDILRAGSWGAREWLGFPGLV